MIQRIRQIGWLEGFSFLILLFIAVPLKYGWDMPIYVRIVGPIHGFLFTVYCLQLVYARKTLSWPTDKALTFFVAALIPFGPFLMDGRLKAEAENG